MLDTEKPVLKFSAWIGSITEEDIDHVRNDGIWKENYIIQLKPGHHAEILTRLITSLAHTARLSW